MNIKETFENHAFILRKINEMLELNSCQYTDLVVWDAERELFEVNIVTESEHGTEYDDVEVTLIALQTYINKENNMKAKELQLPTYLQHLTVVENSITVDSARDKVLLVEWLKSMKAKFNVEQKTVSRAVYHVKRIEA